MGWWKLITNAGSAEGIREAMRMSFDKHVRQAEQGRIGGPPLHAGLYGALATRMMMRQLPSDEASLVPEIAPFMKLDQAEAREAIAEYAVLQECPQEARKLWLADVVKRGSRRAGTEREYQAVFCVARIRQLVWTGLLTDQEWSELGLDAWLQGVLADSRES